MYTIMIRDNNPPASSTVSSATTSLVVGDWTYHLVQSHGPLLATSTLSDHFLTNPSTLSQKYGPIMHLWLGSVPIVVGSYVQVGKTFLKTHGSTFASWPEMSSRKYIFYDGFDILWSPYGSYCGPAHLLWKQVNCQKQSISYWKQR